MRILLVEDDRRFAAALATALRRHGYEVDQAGSLARARAARPCDLILLDLGLPDGDGVDWLRELREEGTTPVIAVTARGEERDRVRGLRSGADDYLVKPFGVAELEARIEAVMRRVRVPSHAPVSIGDLEIDPARRTVHRDGAEIRLTRKEFDLLALLVRAGGRVVSREQLLAEVWRTTWQGTSRTLEVHVGSVRNKLGDPEIIKTVRGIGYRLRTG